MNKGSEILPIIKEQAPLILAEIKKAKSVLLHCHPSPDPDSVGSALAMKFALEQLGKKATVIKGDSEIPQAFMHFPGAKGIAPKNFGEVDLKEFDLFISLDTSALNRITDTVALTFPSSLCVINIDHHPTNTKFGRINLVVETYPATAQILYELFMLWNVELTPEIAANLFIGIYTDTGGLKFGYTNARSYQVMAELVNKFPGFAGMIDIMENSNTPGAIAYEGAALNSVETFLGGHMAMASVSNALMKEKNIEESDIGGVKISSFLKSVIGWDVCTTLVELKPGYIKVRMRTRDENKYDVSRLAVALGGGGHKSAAGAGLQGMSLDDAKKLVVAKAKELYNL